MKTIRLLVITILVVSCSNAVPINPDGIVIEKTSKHPILSDHCKILKTKDSDGKIIDELEIYPDPGIGCDAYLFANGEDYTFIDCNGQWYTIEKSSGKIEKGDWNWMEDPPGDCITIYKESSSQEFNKSESNLPSLEAIYQFKDPQ